MTAHEAFDSYHRQVFSFVCRLTRSPQTAEDITQECFLALVRAPHKYDENKGALRAYLFAIARNLALKHYRDRGGEEQLAGEMLWMGADPRPGLEAVTAVERAVAALPLLEREALILFQYEGLTLAEIAEVAGAEVGTVKGRLHRARERLRIELAPYRRVGERNGME
jgi:RNA polymerase sigma-70 factor (ECF subfamily)